MHHTINVRPRPTAQRGITPAVFGNGRLTSATSIAGAARAAFRSSLRVASAAWVLGSAGSALAQPLTILESSSTGIGQAVTQTSTVPLSWTDVEWEIYHAGSIGSDGMGGSPPHVVSSASLNLQASAYMTFDSSLGSWRLSANVLARPSTINYQGDAIPTSAGGTVAARIVFTPTAEVVLAATPQWFTRWDSSGFLGDLSATLSTSAHVALSTGNTVLFERSYAAATGAGRSDITSGVAYRLVPGTRYTLELQSAASSYSGNSRSDATSDMTSFWVIRPAGCPTIVQQPQPTSSCGGSAAFSVAADGAAPRTYVWRRNGTPISSASNPSAATATLVLTGLAPAEAGNYDCIVTNACGSVTSNPATLTICIGEFNCDGGIDGADVDAFFADWESGNAAADVNADGGIDGADVSTFFEHWEAGC